MLRAMNFRLLLIALMGFADDDRLKVFFSVINLFFNSLTSKIKIYDNASTYTIIRKNAFILR